MVSTVHNPSVHNRQSGSDAGVGSWDLVAAAQAGDREAFGRLYARYAAGVARYVSHRVPDPYLAQDFTGETFARALRRIDSISDQGRDVGAWLTTIARNLLADHWKSSRAHRETSVANVADITDVAADVAHRDVAPEQAVLAAETAARVRAAMAGLTPPQQEVIRLRYFDELPVAAVAAVTGRTDEAVKALTHRGLLALRAQLRPPPPTPATKQVADPLVRARQAVSEVTTRVATARRQAAAQARGRATIPTDSHELGPESVAEDLARGVA